MKVNNTNTAEVYKAYNAASPDQVSSTQSDPARKSLGSGSAIQDKVNISSKVQQMNEIDNAVAASPEVRQDKVAEVEQQIKAGNYKADYNKIADKLLSHDLSARI